MAFGLSDSEDSGFKVLGDSTPQQDDFKVLGDSEAGFGTTVVKTAIHAAPSSAGFLIGSSLGSMVGTAFGAGISGIADVATAGAAAPFNPLIVAGSEFVGGLVGGFIGGWGADKLRDTAISGILGEDTLSKYEEEQKQLVQGHRQGAMLGDFLGSALSFGVGVKAPLEAYKFAGTLKDTIIKDGTKGVLELAATAEGKAQLHNLVGISFGVGTQAKSEIDNQIEQGDGFKPVLLMESMLSGLLLNNPEYMKQLRGAPDMFTGSQNFDKVADAETRFKTDEQLNKTVRDLQESLQKEKEASKGNPLQSAIEKILGSDNSMTVDDLLKRTALKGIRQRFSETEDPQKQFDDIKKHIRDEYGVGITPDEATAKTLNDEYAKDPKSFHFEGPEVYVSDKRFFTDEDIKQASAKGGLNLFTDIKNMETISSGDIQPQHIEKLDDFRKLFTAAGDDEAVKMMAKLKGLMAQPEFSVPGAGVKYGPKTLYTGTPEDFAAKGYKFPASAILKNGKIIANLGAVNDKGTLILNKETRLQDLVEDGLELPYKANMGQEFTGAGRDYLDRTRKMMEDRINGKDIKTGVTKDAIDLLDSLGDGVPAFVSKNMERIAKENGIDSSNLTPNEVIEQLKAKVKTSKGTAETDPAVIEKLKTILGHSDFERMMKSLVFNNLGQHPQSSNNDAFANLDALGLKPGRDVVEYMHSVIGEDIWKILDDSPNQRKVEYGPGETEIITLINNPMEGGTERIRSIVMDNVYKHTAKEKMLELYKLSQQDLRYQVNKDAFTNKMRELRDMEPSVTFSMNAAKHMADLNAAVERGDITKSEYNRAYFAKLREEGEQPGHVEEVLKGVYKTHVNAIAPVSEEAVDTQTPEAFKETHSTEDVINTFSKEDQSLAGNTIARFAERLDRLVGMISPMHKKAARPEDLAPDKPDTKEELIERLAKQAYWESKRKVDKVPSMAKVAANVELDYIPKADEPSPQVWIRDPEFVPKAPDENASVKEWQAYEEEMIKAKDAIVMPWKQTAPIPSVADWVEKFSAIESRFHSAYDRFLEESKEKMVTIGRNKTEVPSVKSVLKSEEVRAADVEKVPGIVPAEEIAAEELIPGAITDDVTEMEKKLASEGSEEISARQLQDYEHGIPKRNWEDQKRLDPTVPLEGDKTHKSQIKQVVVSGDSAVQDAVFYGLRDHLKGATIIDATSQSESIGKKMKLGKPPSVPPALESFVEELIRNPDLRKPGPARVDFIQRWKDAEAALSPEDKRKVVAMSEGKPFQIAEDMMKTVLSAEGGPSHMIILMNYDSDYLHGLMAQRLLHASKTGTFVPLEMKIQNPFDTRIVRKVDPETGMVEYKQVIAPEDKNFDKTLTQLDTSIEDTKISDAHGHTATVLFAEELAYMSKNELDALALKVRDQMIDAGASKIIIHANDVMGKSKTGETVGVGGKGFPEFMQVIKAAIGPKGLSMHENRMKTLVEEESPVLEATGGLPEGEKGMPTREEPELKARFGEGTPASGSPEIVKFKTAVESAAGPLTVVQSEAMRDYVGKNDMRNSFQSIKEILPKMSSERLLDTMDAAYKAAQDTSSEATMSLKAEAGLSESRRNTYREILGKDFEKLDSSKLDELHDMVVRTGGKLVNVQELRDKFPGYTSKQLSELAVRSKEAFESSIDRQDSNIDQRANMLRTADGVKQVQDELNFTANASLNAADDLKEIAPWMFNGAEGLHERFLDLHRDYKASLNSAIMQFNKWMREAGISPDSKFFKDMTPAQRDLANKMLEAVGAQLEGSNMIVRKRGKYAGVSPTGRRVFEDPIGDDAKQAMADWNAGKLKGQQTAEEFMANIRSAYDESRTTVNEDVQKLTQKEYIKYLNEYVNHEYRRSADQTPEEFATFSKRFVEETARSKTRKIPTYEEAAKYGLMPITQNAAQLYKMWGEKVYKNKFRKLFLNSAVGVRNLDGTPSVVAIENPRNKGDKIIEDSSLKQMKLNLAEYVKNNNDAVKASREGELIELDKDGLLPASEMKKLGYTEMASPFDSIEKFYVMPGREGENTMKMLLDSKMEWRPFGGRDWMKGIENYNSFAKQSILFGSAFHPFSLMENYLSYHGLSFKNPLFHPVKFLEDYRAANKRYNEDPEIMSRAIESGLQIHHSDPNINAGATDKLVQSAIDRLKESDSSFKSTFGDVGQRVFDFKKRWDNFLWNNMHPTLKLMMYEDAYGKAKDAMTRKQLHFDDKVIRENVAALTNKALGGLEMEKYMWATPHSKQMLHALMFAPDWTLSVAEAAGITQLPGVKQFLGSEMSGTEAQVLGKKYWPAMAGIFLLGLPNAIQASIYAAFGKKEEGDQLFNFQNEVGKKMSIDVTPLLRHLPGYEGGDTGKRRVYMRWGKQAYEVGGWFTEPITTAMNKSSMAIHTVYEQVTGTSTSGFALPFAKDGLLGLFEHDGKFLESRLGYVAQKGIPMWVLNALTDKPIGWFATASRGASLGTTLNQMEDVLSTYANRGTAAQLKGMPNYTGRLDQLMGDVIQAAYANGIDVKEAMDRATNGALTKSYLKFYKAMNSGDQKEMQHEAEAIIRLNKGVAQAIKSMQTRMETSGQKFTPEKAKQVIDIFKKASESVQPNQEEVQALNKFKAQIKRKQRGILSNE